MNEAEQYETPLVTDHGDLVELTAATNVGNRVDVPYGTLADPGHQLFYSAPVAPGNH